MHATSGIPPTTPRSRASKFEAIRIGIPAAFNASSAGPTSGKGRQAVERPKWSQSSPNASSGSGSSGRTSATIRRQRRRSVGSSVASGPRRSSASSSRKCRPNRAFTSSRSSTTPCRRAAAVYTSATEGEGWIKVPTASKTIAPIPSRIARVVIAVDRPDGVRGPYLSVGAWSGSPSDLPRVESPRPSQRLWTSFPDRQGVPLPQDAPHEPGRNLDARPSAPAAHPYVVPDDRRRPHRTIPSPRSSPFPRQSATLVPGQPFPPPRPQAATTGF